MHPNPFGLAHSQSPVDLPEPLFPDPHALRWTSMVIVTAALLLALLNAPAIRGWAYELPESASSERAVAVAERWYGAVGRLGLNAPVETMHGRWQDVKEARFHTPSPG
jgi:hypothetical protein